MARHPRFEIVRTDAKQPWHARFRAANGRIVWQTENYTQRRGALFAVWSIAEVFHGHVHDTEVRVNFQPGTAVPRKVAEVRDVDERTQA